MSVVPFDRYMDAALYGPDGFYTSRGHAGRRGDFITSVEVGPLFGAVIARFLDAEWRRLGEPSRFVVVDAGAGPGTLARSILAASPECLPCLELITVELSAVQRERHPAGVTSLAELPDGPFDGVIIANELLDNLPFRLAVYDGGWREAFVDLSGAAPAEVLSVPFDPRPAVLPPVAPHGARAPLQDQARAFIDDARSRLSGGRLVIFDYCTPTTTELALSPWREWLRTYRGHERGRHYLADAGEQDITAQVAIDQLPEPDAVRSQAQWLQLHGIDELVAEGKAAWEAAAARPDVAAMRMRSRISESEALLDPSGLGAFTVLDYLP